MRKVLKVGDARYSKGIRPSGTTRFEEFPQREQFLLANMPDLTIDLFKHEALSDLEVISQERERLSDYLKGKQFDFILVDNPLSSLLVESKLSTKLLFDCIDWYDELYLKEFGVDKHYYLIRYGLLDLLARAERVVAQSPVILEALKVWGLKTERMAVIPNGYDAKLFYPYSSQRIGECKRDIEKELDVSLAGKDVIVYSGRLTSWYDGIKAIAEAVAEDQVLLIVGDGPLLSEIPERHNVIRVGFVPSSRVPDFTNIADVLVYPVDSDCSPIVISEYLALGKPIVMPKGRMEWLLKEGETGCFVDSSPYSWRRGIGRALAERGRFGKRNLELAADLSWEKLGRKFSDFVAEP